MDFLYCCLCTRLLVLLLGMTEKGLTLSSLLPPIRYFVHFDKTLPELSLLRAKQAQLSLPLIVHQMFQAISCILWICPSTSMSLLYWGSQKWTEYSTCATHHYWLEEKDHFFWLAGHAGHALTVWPLSRGHFAGRFATCHPPGLPLLNFMRFSPAHFSSLSRSPSPSEWLHNHLLYHSLCPILYYLQTCWVHTLPHYPGH